MTRRVAATFNDMLADACASYHKKVSSFVVYRVRPDSEGEFDVFAVIQTRVCLNHMDAVSVRSDKTQRQRPHQTMGTRVLLAGLPSLALLNVAGPRLRLQDAWTSRADRKA